MTRWKLNEHNSSTIRYYDVGENVHMAAQCGRETVGRRDGQILANLTFISRTSKDSFK